MMMSKIHSKLTNARRIQANNPESRRPIAAKCPVKPSILMDTRGVRHAVGDLISSKPKSKKTSPQKVSRDEVVFTEDQIKVVRESIRRARQGVEEWNERARVDSEKMRRPLTR